MLRLIEFFFWKITSFWKLLKLIPRNNALKNNHRYFFLSKKHKLIYETLNISNTESWMKCCLKVRWGNVRAPGCRVVWLSLCSQAVSKAKLSFTSQNGFWSLNFCRHFLFMNSFVVIFCCLFVGSEKISHVKKADPAKSGATLYDVPV